jgi:hypothetical protein
MVGIAQKRLCPPTDFCLSGKSLKICPALPRKIFRFPRRANQRYQLAPSRSEQRGVGHRRERWDGMRWTRQRRARDCDRRAVLRERSCSARTNGASTPPPRLRPGCTRAAEGLVEVAAYGKAVWSWHPLLVSSWRRLFEPNRVSISRQSAGDGDKTNSSPGRARYKPLKPLRRENKESHEVLWSPVDSARH